MKKLLSMKLNIFRKLTLVFLLAGGLMFFQVSDLRAQACGPSTFACGNDADCTNPNLTNPCPDCFGCVGGVCQPVDLNCDDGNVCTQDVCLPFIAPGLFGCVNLSEALLGDPALPAECYVCEPTENNVTVNNGICDPGAGEDCTNTPDCQVPGEVCGPPPDPPFALCDIANPALRPLLCPDGEVCTDDVCDINLGQCLNPAKTCQPVADGCCPVNPATGMPCQLPPPGQSCPINPPDPNCDPDCWPPQSCGDDFVQPPETCDDNATTGNAGIKPDGTPVTNTECRDPGTVDECTYCGDNILQAAAGEQCDGTDAAVCNGLGCDANCNCNITALCLTGSGPLVDGGLNADCKCSLNKEAVPGGAGDHVLLMGLATVLGAGLLFRRRRKFRREI